jgi:hypothetical protein
MGWDIWTPMFHNTWCIWTGITNICREFGLTKTSKSKFPGVCPGGMSRFRFDSRITRPPFLFFHHNQQYDTLLPILPCTQKLKPGIAYWNWELHVVKQFSSNLNL